MSINNKGNMTDEQSNFSSLYLGGHVLLKDVPLEFLSKELLLRAMGRELLVTIEYLFELVEGGFDIDILYYLNKMPLLTEQQKYYDRFFNLDPVNNYCKLPDAKKTSEMADTLIDLDPGNIKIIYEPHKTLKHCVDAFNYDKNLIRFIPSKFKTREMCEASITHNPELIECVPPSFRDFDMYLHYVRVCASKKGIDLSCVKVYDYFATQNEYLSFLECVPEEYLTQKLYENIFSVNPLMYIVFPFSVRTLRMSKLIYKLYGDVVLRYVPQKFLPEVRSDSSKINGDKTKLSEMYALNFEAGSSYQIKYIPLEYRDQKIYDIYFDKGGVDVLPDIPFDYRTQRMYDSVVLKPVLLDRINGIPDKYITKEIYLCMIKHNLSKYLSKMFLIDIDSEVWAEISSLLKYFISNGKKINVRSEKTMDSIVGSYPELIRAFSDDYVEKRIMNDLILSVSNDETIGSIARKYALSEDYVRNILNKMNSNVANAVNAALNEKMYDVLFRLNMIVLLLGEVKDNKLTREQKIKFAYLFDKYINFSMEEIYRFLYKMSSVNDLHFSNLRLFLESMFKCDYLYGNFLNSDIMVDDETIKLNNSWLDIYSRDRFFAMKNGKMMLERRYGKDSKLLTFDIEKIVIDELVINDIPLRNIIVQGAFRAYFDGDLEKYVKQFVGYADEYEKLNRERER